MISVVANGGLANMMFQIAFLKSFGKEHGFETAIAGLPENLRRLKGNYSRSPHADEYLTLFKNLNWTANTDRLYEINANRIIPFHYITIEPEDNKNYLGYFQCEQYFPDKDFIKWLFEPADWLTDEISNLTATKIYEGIKTCAIHVRRGDYLDLQQHHPVLGLDYYRRAVAAMKPFKIDRFLVFSDDIEWCMRAFPGNRFVFLEHKDYLDLFLMAHCDHFIIANSSFSWWAAWLGETRDSVVIAPLQWFGPACRDSSKDIVPFRWIKL